VGLIGDALQALADFAKHTLATTGYPGLVLLMAAESMLLPIPSEAVMPFAGVLVHDGTFSWAGAILASSLGSGLGSYLSYQMGTHGLLPLVTRYGRYVLIQEHHISKATDFFTRRGTVAVFVCRFIPGVRHVSSMPAGAARMPLLPFMIASVLGATLWNTFLLYIGYRFAGNDAAVAAVKHNMDLIGIVLLVLLVAYVTYEVLKARKAKREGFVPPPE
jgi:membrane protein DedA with SNARE-associated domain